MIPAVRKEVAQWLADVEANLSVMKTGMEGAPDFLKGAFKGVVDATIVYRDVLLQFHKQLGSVEQIFEAQPVCELCGGTVVDRNCKAVCVNCGFKRDCTDP